MPNHCAHVTRYYDHLLRHYEQLNNYEAYFVDYERLLDIYTNYLFLEFDP